MMRLWLIFLISILSTKVFALGKPKGLHTRIDFSYTSLNKSRATSNSGTDVIVSDMAYLGGLGFQYYLSKSFSFAIRGEYEYFELDAGSDHNISEAEVSNINYGSNFGIRSKDIEFVFGYFIKNILYFNEPTEGEFETETLQSGFAQAGLKFHAKGKNKYFIVLSGNVYIPVSTESPSANTEAAIDYYLDTEVQLYFGKSFRFGLFGRFSILSFEIQEQYQGIQSVFGISLGF